MRPSAHGTWLRRNAVCLYLYMCIIIPSSFQALPGWTIVTCSHLLNAWSSSSSTKTVTKWRNWEAQSQKKGSVTGLLVFCLMRNSCFTWHFPFYFMNNPKGSSVNFFPLSAVSKVRAEDSYYASWTVGAPKLLFWTTREKQSWAFGSSAFKWLSGTPGVVLSASESRQ